MKALILLAGVLWFEHRNVGVRVKNTIFLYCSTIFYNVLISTFLYIFIFLYYTIFFYYFLYWCTSFVPVNYKINLNILYKIVDIRVHVCYNYICKEVMTMLRKIKKLVVMAWQAHKLQVHRKKLNKKVSEIQHLFD